MINVCYIVNIMAVDDQVKQQVIHSIFTTPGNIQLTHMGTWNIDTYV